MQHVMDCVTLEYSENQNKLPVYGYKSYEYDSVLYGDIVVTGTFMLNKDDIVTLHRYTQKRNHPETERFPVNFNEKSFLTQSKLAIQVLHKTDVLRAEPIYTRKHFESVFTIEDVEITGVRHSINATGDPLGEFYDFIGKRVGDTPAILQDS